MLPGETILSGAAPPESELIPLKVCNTSAGYFIGSSEDGQPYSRESDYLRTHDDAQALLGVWTDQIASEHHRSGDDWLTCARRLYADGLLAKARV